MPKFPTYQRQQPLSGGSTGSYADGGALSAPGRALQAAGGDVAQLGNEFAKVANKIRQSQDDTWFSKARAETAVDMIGVEQEAQKGATDGAKDYTTGMSQRFQEYRQQKVAGAPTKRAQQLYEEWADTYGVSVTSNAAKFQAESELAKRTTDFSDAMNAHAQAIYADPAQYDTVYKRAMDDFEGAKQWMTPEQEAVAREKVDHDLKLSRAKSMVEFSPADFQREVAGTSDPKAYREAISSIESGGRYDAVGPTHKTMGRALGKYQIMEANITRWSKEAIGRAVTSEEFLADPKIQDAIFDHRFGGYVKQYGLEGAAQAWFAGPGGVGKTDRKDVLGTDVGSYGQKFIKALGAKGIVSDPRFAGLSVDEIRSLSTQADQTVNAERTALYNQVKDSMQLGIATGQVISEDQILGSALGDGDKASLLGQFRTKNKDEAVISQTLAALADRSLNVSPYDAEATKALDTISERAEKGGSLEQFVQSSEEIVRQSGIVPKPYMNRIRQGLESTNVEQVGAAAELARRVGQIDPAAFGRRDGGSKVADAATAYSHYVDTVGMTPEQAAQRLIDMNDPEKVKARASLMESKPTKDWITKKATESNVRDIFDPGVFGFDPTLGSNPAQSAAMVGEYRSILEESLWDANGDQELAVTFAGQRFAKRYGTSSFTLDGETAVTRLPPEKTYPVGADGTHGYVMDQARAALKAEGVDASVVYLQSDDLTNRDYSTGQPARYQVFYETSGNKWPSAEKMPSLKLTTQESNLYRHHIDNLNENKVVKNGDGSVSTLYQTSIDIKGKTYNFPTVWDGKILEPSEAAQRAVAEKGLDYWPSYDSVDAADSRYQAMHHVLEEDVGAFLNGTQKVSPQIERFNLPFYALPEAEAGIPRSTIMESRARRDQYRQERFEKGTLEDRMRRDATPPDDYVSPLLGKDPVAQ
jgi:hypothetical protein